MQSLKGKHNFKIKLLNQILKIKGKHNIKIKLLNKILKTKGKHNFKINLLNQILKTKRKKRKHNFKVIKSMFYYFEQRGKRENTISKLLRAYFINSMILSYLKMIV